MTPAPTSDQPSTGTNLSAVDEPAKPSFELTSDMLEGSGLEDAEEGDVYSFTVKGTVTKAGDPVGIDIESVTDAKESTGGKGPEEGEDIFNGRKTRPASKTLNMKEAGLDIGGGDEEEEEP